MKKLIFILCIVGSTSVLASTPEVVITHTDSYNGYATVAGRLEEDPGKAVGISVENGGIRYSTVTDINGKWAIVIRHRAYNLSARSWDLDEPESMSELVTKVLKSN